MKIDNNIDNEKIRKKKQNLLSIVLSVSVFSPWILFCAGYFLYCFFTFKLSLAFFFLFLLIVSFISLESYIIKSINYLIYGKEKPVFPKKSVQEQKPLVSIADVNEYDARVEGIISERERDLVDKDDDGYILVHEYYPLTETDVLFKVLQKDNNFSKIDFYNYVKSLFILMQEAWSNNDYIKLRSFEADRLYYRHKRELERLKAASENDIRDNINIKGVLLKDFRIENNKQILVVALTANMRRKYNGEETEENYPYIMAFSRNVGVKTNKKVKLSVTNCCNCGAAVNVSDDGVCKYCDTSLVSGEHEWVLVDMKLINIDLVFNNKKRN